MLILLQEVCREAKVEMNLKLQRAAVDGNGDDVT